MPDKRGFFAGSRIHRPAPPSHLPQCGTCGLHATCKHPRMPVTGGGGRGVLFVAEAPAAQEDEKGIQLTGRAGEVLRRVLARCGFDLEKDGWKTNAVICHPPRSRKPTTAEVACCYPNLAKVIKEYNPQVIIPLGGSAVAAVVGGIWRRDVGPVERWVGWRIPCQQYNAWVCPTWHPAHIIREDDPVLTRQFQQHIAAAVTYTARPWGTDVPEWGADVRRVHDPAKAAAWLQRAAKMPQGAIAWDYETNMLKPDGPDAQIVSCAVAWGRTEPEKCIAFPWHGAAVGAMRTLLRSPIPKIASNLKFEDRWTRKEFGHRVRGWAWDTMLAAHVCDNRPGITSVKFQAFVRCGAPVWNDKVEQFLKTKGTENANAILREIDIDDLLLYNGLDALLEFRVACDQIRELGYPWPWRIDG